MPGAGDLVRTTWVKDFGQFQRDLARIEPHMRDEFRDAIRPVAAEVVANVKTSMPHRTGAAAGSVRSSVTNKGAYVKEGNRSVPYVGWLDFGGTLKPTGRRRGTQYRSVFREGRYLYPTIMRMRPKIAEAAAWAVEMSARAAGWKG